MSSYGSNHSGYLHPAQYPPNPQQHQAQQPMYPTTPGPPPQTSQPQAYFPPVPEQQEVVYSSSPSSQYQQPMYSTSPSSQYQQPMYSSSPSSQYLNPLYSSSPTAQVLMPGQQQPPMHHRRSSSLSQQGRPQFTSTAPIAIPHQRPPIYARSHGSHASHHSHHSAHMYDPNAFADGEHKYDAQAHGGLDEDTLREYERRYAKDRELEKRPTLGGSLMSMVKTLSGKRQ